MTALRRCGDARKISTRAHSALISLRDGDKQSAPRRQQIVGGPTSHPGFQMKERRNEMSDSQECRVLSRMGARLLTDEEMNCVTAALGTTTKCSFDPRTGHRDGDIGEC